MVDYHLAIGHYVLAMAYFERPARMAGIPREPDVRQRHVCARLHILSRRQQNNLRKPLEEEVKPKYGFERTRFEAALARMFYV